MERIPELKEPAFPLVVSGPSGVGKTVLCDRLVSALPWTVRQVTVTTRPPRPGERDGESYFFYSEERFRQERERGGLAEWAEVHGHLYGTPRPWLDRKLNEGTSVALNIDVQGGLSIRQVYPRAVLVFVLPPSWAGLEQRLRRRGADSEAEMRRRLATAEAELRVLPRYDYVIINEDLETAVAELVSIARAERARVGRRLS